MPIAPTTGPTIIPTGPKRTNPTKPPTNAPITPLLLAPCFFAPTMVSTLSAKRVDIVKTVTIIISVLEIAVKSDTKYKIPNAPNTNKIPGRLNRLINTPTNPIEDNNNFNGNI